MNSEIVALIVSAGITAVSIIWTIISTIKKRKASGEANATADTLAIMLKVPALITESETIFGRGNGLAKLSYVLNKIELACVKNNLDFDEEQAKSEIERILETPQKKENEKEIK